MIIYVEDKLPEIITNCEELFPDRYRILKDSFNAHNEKRYCLSIPTLLAQADGIFKELFGKEFYTNDEKVRKRRAKVILSKLNQNGNKVHAASFTYLFLKQLEEESSLHAPYSETQIFSQGEDEGILNRHEVLHGIAKKYDTKLNSWSRQLV